MFCLTKASLIRIPRRSLLRERHRQARLFVKAEIRLKVKRTLVSDKLELIVPDGKNHDVLEDTITIVKSRDTNFGISITIKITDKTMRLQINKICKVLRIPVKQPFIIMKPDRVFIGFRPTSNHCPSRLLTCLHKPDPTIYTRTRNR
jgi:hypothetical protein